MGSTCFELKYLVDTGRCPRCGYPDMENIYDDETGDVITICGNCGLTERVHPVKYEIKYDSLTEPIKA